MISLHAIYVVRLPRIDISGARTLIMTTYFSTSLPAHGVPMLIPEIISAGENMEGKSVRVVGRVEYHDVSELKAWLIEPNKTSSSTTPKLVVDTSLTDASDFRLGSQVMLIGEFERCEEWVQHTGTHTGHRGGNVILKPRVSRCVDRLDYALYCNSVNVLRKVISSDTGT